MTLCTSAAAQTAPPEPAAQEDRVHFGDVIDLDVVGGFEYDWRGSVTSEGYLDGVDAFDEPVFALCRTEAEIATEARRIFGKTLRDPQIVIRIVDRSNRAAARLDGAIRNPTRFSIRRKVFLNELLILAGGLTDSSSGNITIFRPENGGCTNISGGRTNASQTSRIKISELLGGKVDANPQISGGDLITVERALPIYVIGAIKSPGPVYARDQMTISRVISTAGGLAKDANGYATIYRRDRGETRVIDVDLKKVRDGGSVDEILRSFDILDVASKGGGKRKYPPVAATDGNNRLTRVELPLRVIE